MKKKTKRLEKEAKWYERGKQLKETYGKISEKDLRNSIFIKDAKMFMSGFAMTGALVAIDHYFDKPAAMVAARAMQPLTYAGMAYVTANGIRDIQSLRTYNNSGRK